MATLLRTFPVALTVTLAFAAPFVAVACSESPTISGSSGATSTSGSTSTSTSAGTGGASATSTASASSTATGTGGSAAASTTGAGGSGGSTATSSGSTTSASSGAGGSGGAVSDAGNPDAPLNCGTIVTQYAVDPSPHITTCFPVFYSSNPPTSGPHYPVWAAFKTYTTPIPRGFTVHDLEHGAIVISYKCAGGCSAELAALQAFVDARPADPLCVAPLKTRIVIVPDPLLDVPFAAAAWGFALTSQCFDLPALGAFIDAHYAMGPENFCFDGVDVSSPDAGVPADCGEAADAGAGPG